MAGLSRWPGRAPRRRGSLVGPGPSAPGPGWLPRPRWIRLFGPSLPRSPHDRSRTRTHECRGLWRRLRLGRSGRRHAGRRSTPDARSRAAALLARRDRPAREETADSLLVALTEELLQEDAADPDVGKALAALGAHEAATRRNLRLYDPGARANPDAVWWPVPNHPKRPRRATDELPWAQRHPILDRTTPVGSAGSCFASEVAHRLQRDGFRYVVTQPNRNPTSGTHNACCRWGTIFNVASFRQLIERAYGAWRQEHRDGRSLPALPQVALGRGVVSAVHGAADAGIGVVPGGQRRNRQVPLGRPGFGAQGAVAPRGQRRMRQQPRGLW